MVRTVLTALEVVLLIPPGAIKMRTNFLKCVDRDLSLQREDRLFTQLVMNRCWERTSQLATFICSDLSSPQTFQEALLALRKVDSLGCFRKYNLDWPPELQEECKI